MYSRCLCQSIFLEHQLVSVLAFLTTQPRQFHTSQFGFVPFAPDMFVSPGSQ